MQASSIPKPPVEPEEYSAGYNILLQWISSRQGQPASYDLPKTVEETQELLDRFRQQRAEKENEMKELGVMEKELTEFQQRYEIDFHLPQFTELEQV